ncbi:CDF family Co(II)/Ni(II) efflux transporter DmeF [Geothrix sp. 21YS21S-2]|uniref:CDF family Co(II)/Ni(II) efflux transporter DmeF n=1 Tax=Geothrix sp. 21YS21S-2 TaxID=3068893 RepID=UPI0027BA1D81|nr:CDF family Co(II)/Ni(II) efflux transporter DmeF [Geothrix sp. 21YS21S-2]
MSGESDSLALHTHLFDQGNQAGERGTRLVMAITALMMAVEIVAGWRFNSMALLADGWHMSSHAVAIGVSALAYALARRHAGDRRFAFGTWKIEILGGFASALFLLGVAAWMVLGSAQRLLEPAPIHYREAIAVAGAGLVVNVVCALILGRAHDHGHDHGGGRPAHDLNLRSAYVHVIADAATSVLAILALAGGLAMGWAWLDPVMGFAGAVLVAVWAVGLLRDTTRVLLDAEMDHPVVEEIREVAGAHPEWGRITDLHVWRVGKASYACILALEGGPQDLTPAAVRAAVGIHAELVHITVELG